MSIATNITTIRKYYKFTQQELGRIAGVTDRAVASWEKGIAEPRMGAIQKIADYLHIPKSAIVDDFEAIVNLKNNIELKTRLKELRTSNNMSQGDLAKILDVDKVAVSQWERGVRQPKLETKEALCDLFNVNMDYLIGRTNYVTKIVNFQSEEAGERLTTTIKDKVGTIDFTDSELEKICDYIKLLLLARKE